MRISDWSSDVCSSDLITPGVDLNGTLLTGRGGDPNLDPYRANQYDLSIEWYPDRETIVALAAFYKDIQSYIVNTRSEENTSELQSLMRISYAVFCLKKKKQKKQIYTYQEHIHT